MTQNGAAGTPIAERAAKPKSKFNLNRAQVVDENFIAFVKQLAENPPVSPHKKGGGHWGGRVPGVGPDSEGSSGSRPTPGYFL